MVRIYKDDHFVEMNEEEYAIHTRQMEMKEQKRIREEETQKAILAQLGGDIPRFLLKLCKKLDITPEDVRNG